MVGKYLRILVYILAIYSLFLSGGCAWQKTFGAVEFKSKPAGAEIINLGDDSLLGTTPTKVIWEETGGESKKVTVQFRKQGYLERISDVWVNTRHASREEALKKAQPIEVELLKKK
ncbi:MAG: hypothetical protein OEM02_00115 [Desulfobulbaceae bacterium]|nr:hypothetical protein [Desulfobulbaceae bacterium]